MNKLLNLINLYLSDKLTVAEYDNKIKILNEQILEVNKLISKEEINGLNLINNIKKVINLDSETEDHIKDMCYIIHIDKNYVIGEKAIEKGKENCSKIIILLNEELHKLQEEKDFCNKLTNIKNKIINIDNITEDDLAVINILLNKKEEKYKKNYYLEVYKHNNQCYKNLTTPNIDFLKLYFETEAFNKFKLNCNNEVVEQIEKNKDKIIESINYLKSLGITNIDELLIENISFFMQDINDIKDNFNIYNMENIIKLINSEPKTIRAL